MVGRSRQDPVSDLLRLTMQLRQKADLLNERRLRLLAAATATTPRYSSELASVKADQHKDALWSAVVTASDEHAEAERDYLEHEHRVHKLLAKMSSPAHVAILQYRYCYGLRWPQVQEKLDSLGLYFSERHMFNLHGDALQEARRIYREQEDRTHEDRDRPITDE